MNKKLMNRLIAMCYGASAILVLLGAFLKIQHYPNWNTIFMIGIIIGSAGGLIGVFLNRKNKPMEE